MWNTCHVGLHSVTGHAVEVRMPPLSPAEAGTRFSYPGEKQGWVDRCYVKVDLLGTKPMTCQSQVQHPTTAPRRNNLHTSVVARCQILWPKYAKSSCTWAPPWITPGSVQHSRGREERVWKQSWDGEGRKFWLCLWYCLHVFFVRASVGLRYGTFENL